CSDHTARLARRWLPKITTILKKEVIMRIAALVLAASVFLAATSVAGSVNGKLSPTVGEYLASSTQEPIKIWVYFKDHGERDASELDAMVSRVTLTDRALQRRLNRTRGPLTDVRDLHIHPSYLQELREIGCRVKHTSKYLNAASAIATPDQIRAASRLSFVRKIDRVQTARRELPPAIKEDPAQPNGTGDRFRTPSVPTLDYGDSFNQLDLINVIPLHDANVFGEGVLVAMLDTGFNRSHESLIHLDIVAEWDFINHDPVTKNEPGDPSWQHNHGTYTLSALAGYAPGSLIGPAWAASFVLGKTERVDVEIQQEEDDYVRGLEWADSIGAVIVSSSLGYYDWYTYEDLDGNTAVTTIAGDIAAAKGVAVITAAGNEGPLPWPGIIAPSDGDSVIAVGAVDGDGVIASFSSHGPSYDGRIKPDVCAQGVLVRCASPSDSLGYLLTNGTSLATPLVAGAAALSLKMHPYWSPIDLRDALRASADHAGTPDNEYGWGVIDSYQTALNGASGAEGEPARPPAAATLFQNSPNPFIPSLTGETSIRYLVGSTSATLGGAPAPDGVRDVKIVFYDVAGRLVRVLFDGERLPGGYTEHWDGIDHRGVAVASGVYYYRLSVGGTSVSKKLVLIRR
ncbi:MAG: S8 family serine peptidase, partial [Candidatus Latescibacterota bacterium]